MLLGLIMAGVVLAFQDGIGNSTRSVQNPKTPSPAVKKRSLKPIPKRASRRTAGPVRTGRSEVKIAVNEPEAEIQLTDRRGKSVLDTLFVTTDQMRSPLVLSSIQNGTYELTVRKPGFAEHRQVLTVSAGVSNSVTVSLVATSSFLTLAGKLDGAEIVVEGVGTFRGPLRRLQLKPGTYRVRVTKPDFWPATFSVTLSFLGEEKVMIPTFTPKGRQ